MARVKRVLVSVGCVGSVDDCCGGDVDDDMMDKQ